MLKVIRFRCFLNRNQYVVCMTFRQYKAGYIHTYKHLSEIFPNNNNHKIKFKNKN